MEEQRRRLSRDRDHRMIGGVCAGIARHYDFDPTVVRIVFVILALVSGFGLIVYLVMWLLLPSSERVEEPARQVVRGNLDEMTERARLAADAARAAAEAARQAADQLAEATRATVAAARDTWQQGSQPSGSQQGTPPPAEDDSPAAAAGEAAGASDAEATSSKGEITPDGSQSTWPPDRPLPQTETEPSQDEPGAAGPESEAEGPRGGAAST